MNARAEIQVLKEELEKLALLEEVAERRQELVEKRLAQALEAGFSPEDLRAQLGLSAESLDRLINEDPPPIAERLGVSDETAENLRELTG